MRLVSQSQMIKVSNLDGKVQIDKEMRKASCYRPLYALSSVDRLWKLQQDEPADKSVGKFARRTIRERVIRSQ